jgi:PAS domain S-box-containing protein
MARLGTVAHTGQTVDSELERLFDLSLDLFCVAGFDGHLKRVNRAFERTLGYTQEELLSRPFLELVHPEDVQSAIDALDALATGEDLVGFEGRVISADGSIRWLEWNTRARPKEGVLYGVARDVTDRHETTAELDALRRVATLVARAAEPEEVFHAVAGEVGTLFGSDLSVVSRFEDDGTATVLGAVGWPDAEGARVEHEPGYPVYDVRETMRSARFDTDDPTAEGMPTLVRSLGVRSAVASPILVEGELWGSIAAASLDRSLPPGAEQRLSEFTSLIGTAIANTQARQQVTTLAEEQAALRQVATLVASESSPMEIFQAVTEEAARVLDTEAVGLLRFEPDAAAATLVAQSQTPWEPPPLGTRFTLEGENLVAEVLRTREAVRVDDWTNATGSVAAMASVLGVRSSVATPIVVEGRLWGTIVAVTSQSEPLPADTETRLGQFTELVATAIANAEARTEVARLADEQAALRRVATLVAQGVPSAQIFPAVSKEVERLFRLKPGSSDVAAVIRFDPGPEFVLVGASRHAEELPLGSRWPPKDLYASTRVLRTGRSARVDEHELASTGGVDAKFLLRHGYLSQVACPISVEGGPWGAITMNSAGELPADTEKRLESFTELVATAISNAESRGALARLAAEQAALRRVATLVAENVTAEELFSAVALEVSNVLEVSDVMLERYELGRTTVMLASRDESSFPIWSRWPLDGPSIASTVFDTGRPARINDYSNLDGTIAQAVRSSPMKSAVGVPITVQGTVWGVMSAGVRGDEPLPAGSEERLSRFTELVATALSNAESRESVARLLDEQAALRRVATLVARGVRPAEMFSAVTAEVSRVIDVPEVSVVRYESDGSATQLSSFSLEGPLFPVGTRWSLEGTSVIRLIRESSKAARIDDYSGLEGQIADVVRRRGLRSRVGVPIVAAGRLWGAMVVSGTKRLPDETEARLADFTELLATAIANAESRDAVERLADEQAALRRVATLVAEGTAPERVFAAVAEEVGLFLGVDVVNIVRHERGLATAVASWSGIGGTIPLGKVLPLQGPSIMATVARSGRSHRIDDYWDVPDAVTYVVEGVPILRAGVGVPITVEGRVWGTVVALTASPGPLPAGTEKRLAEFTELVATAIANAESRESLQRLADEQSALRRVATLVAEAAPPAEIFAAACNELARLFRSATQAVLRFEDDAPPALVVVGMGEGLPDIPIGTRSELEEGFAVTEVYRTGRAARVDARKWTSIGGPLREPGRRRGLDASVASPIVVEGRLWGATTVSAREPFPLGTEERLQRFSDMLAIAIANAESREAVAELVDEQAALRRVATLVAEGAQPADVFAAVAEEVGRLAAFGGTNILRYEADGTAAVVAGWTELVAPPDGLEIGAHVPIEGETLTALVFRSGAPARVDDYGKAEGPLAPQLRGIGVNSAVGAPIVVEGKLWGLMAAGSTRPEPLPSGLESRLAEFTELLGTAIANAESRAELTASRARIVAASDDARRRIERDLHDGAQQRLVSLGLELRTAEEALPEELSQVRARVGRVADEIDGVIDELREMSRGIHPAILAEGGLVPALEALARRAALPVELDIESETRLAPHVEVAAYYVVSEALTNTAKHANASRARVSVEQQEGRVRLSIDDDGDGGADPEGGSGLVGLRDRVEALGGSFSLSSPPGEGTVVTAELPVSDDGVHPET